MSITIKRNHNDDKFDSSNTKFRKDRYMIIIAGHGALTKVAEKNSVLWDAMPCNTLKVNGHF